MAIASLYPKTPTGWQEYRFDPLQHNRHCDDRDRFLSSVRRDRLWYRGRVSRMTQLNQLSKTGDKGCYVWLKALWRKELYDYLSKDHS